MENKTGTPDQSINFARAHNMQVYSRKRAALTGIEMVKLAQDSKMILASTDGDIIITGSDMHIAKFSNEEGSLSIEGKIDAFFYTDSKEKAPLIKRLLK